MYTIPSTEARHHFAQHLTKAAYEVVKVTRPGQQTIVMISEETYNRLQELEDAVWMQRALKSKAEGFVPQELVENVLEKARRLFGEGQKA